MATLDDLLTKKGRDVFTITPERTIHDAIGDLCRHHVGALLVIDGHGKLLGIVSERDILVEVNERPGGLRERVVEDIMTRDLVVCQPDESLDYAMAVMTRKRVRHLPVVVDGEIRGIISIGDVVKAKLSEAAWENVLLHRYIADDYPG